MTAVEQSIELEVPVRVAFDQWTRFEDFPRFMEGVQEVQRIDDTHTHWRTSVAGKDEEFDAVLTDQTTDARIAWRSVDGPSHAGVVTFGPLGTDRSRIMLQMEVEPDGVVEKVGAALGVLGHRTKGDLERFKELVESRADAPGDFRPQVATDDGMSTTPPQRGLVDGGSGGGEVF